MEAVTLNVAVKFFDSAQSPFDDGFEARRESP